MSRLLRGAGALVLAASACEPQLPPPGPPALLQRIAGHTQSGVVSATLPIPITIRVIDRLGQPVPLVTIHYDLRGGGQLAQDSVQTDVEGTARNAWTLGPVAGPGQEVLVRAGDSTVSDSLRQWFTAIAVPDVPATIRTPDTTAVVAVAGRVRSDPLVVVVEDRFGNPVPDVTVTWSVTGGGSVAPAVTNSDSLGRAAAMWTVPVQPGTATAAVAQLGSVTFTARLTQPVVAVSAGHAQACALTEAGEVWCWGDGRMEPVMAGGGDTFATVSAGKGYQCAVATGGVGYCWGSGFLGELGDSLAQSRSDPYPVAGGLTWAVIEAGAGHTCGITTDGVTYCWGAADQHCVVGACPLVHGVVDSVPRALAGDPGFTSVAADGNRLSGPSGFPSADWRACGVTGDGAVWCWGDDGQGDRTLVRRYESFNVTTIAAGTDRTCVLTTAGAVYCDSAVPTFESAGVTLASISAGAGHQCGLTSDGQAYCWGENGLGQLGTGDSTASTTPVPVRTAVRFRIISAGGYGNALYTDSYRGRHTCGLALDGIAYCWGENDRGQLGDGTGQASPRPVPVLIPPP